VAALALERTVFAHQLKPDRLGVIETLLVELGELEPLTVVLVVTPRAIQLIGGRFVNAGVIASSRGYPARDFGMAIQAL
jgi:hypothetical protein